MVAIIVGIIVGGLILSWLTSGNRQAALQQVERQNALLAEQNELARRRMAQDRCARDGHLWDHEGDYCTVCELDRDEFNDIECARLGHVWVDPDEDLDEGEEPEPLENCDRCGMSRECADSGHRWQYKFWFSKHRNRFVGSRWCEPCERLEYERELPAVHEPWAPPQELVERCRAAIASGSAKDGDRIE